MPNPFFIFVLLFVIMLALKPDTATVHGASAESSDRDRVAELSRAWLDAYVPAGTDGPAEIRINGDWAYARGSFTADAGKAAAETDGMQSGRYLLLFEKADGGWKVLDGIGSAAPGPARRVVP